MFKLFKRRRPTHRSEPVHISAADRLVGAYCGFTPEQWATLPALVKADKREQVAWELRETS